MDNKKIGQISSYILCLLGIVIIIDTFLANQFDIGTYQKGLVLSYCIGFVLINTKFPSISKKKYVVYPLFLMIAQTIFSLVNKYF